MTIMTSDTYRRGLVHMLARYVVPKCYKDDVESQWKNLKFDPRHPKTPEPMATKIGRGDYVPDIYPCAKLHYNPISGFSPTYAKLPIKCSLG